MTQTALALIVFLFPLAYSPGPGNLFFAANGARFGFRATLRANAGYHLATLIVTATIGLGFAAVMDRFPQVFQLLRIAGALYVLWIAWGLARAGVTRRDDAARAARFGDGVVLLLLNPKAYVIIALMFSQFLPAGQTDRVLAVSAITIIFTLNNLIAFSLWTVAGDRIGARFRDEDSARRLNLVFGAVLAAVAVWMLVP